MTTRYSDEFLDSLDPEVAELALEQEADDTDRQPADRIGRERTIPLTGDVGVAAPNDTEAEAIRNLTPGGRDEEEPLDKDLGWVIETIESLTPQQRAVYDCIFVQGLTARDTAARLNISHVRVLGLVERIKVQVAAAAPEGFLDADD